MTKLTNREKDATRVHQMRTYGQGRQKLLRLRVAAAEEICKADGEYVCLNLLAYTKYGKRLPPSPPPI